MAGEFNVNRHAETPDFLHDGWIFSAFSSARQRRMRATMLFRRRRPASSIRRRLRAQRAAVSRASLIGHEGRGTAAHLRCLISINAFRSCAVLPMIALARRMIFRQGSIRCHAAPYIYTYAHGPSISMIYSSLRRAMMPPRASDITHFILMRLSSAIIF